MDGKIIVGNNYLWFGTNKTQLPQGSSFPSGLIVMWSGSTSTIPSGWLLCNGSNGTPDLRNRFIVGAGSTYSVGSTGGEASHVLTVSEMPSHTHGLSNLKTDEAGAHTHTYDGVNSGTRGQYGGGAYFASGLTTGSAGNHSHTISGEIDEAGESKAHENRPPYYALCFIMKI